ncbi:hypothetical protein LJR009_004186 [Bosea sp. LjRoot9]|uniref:hypothetical protein n=1 Tax=Bosea sp. LjRoot9 TaxID=3342341 RepID=UPI003ECE1294
MQQAEPVLDRTDAPLDGLGALGRLEQGLVEGGAVGADAGDLRLQLAARFGIAGQALLDRLELGLAGLFLDLLGLCLAGQLLGVGGLSGGRERGDEKGQ